MLSGTTLAARVCGSVAEEPATEHWLLLRAIVEALAGPRQDIEQSFLQMGEDLASCIRLLEEISAGHEALPAELGSSEFSAATQALADIRDRASTLAAEREGEKDQIGALADTAAEVERPMSDLCRSVRAITLVATNARIVTAGFGTGNEDVAAFTSDMTVLARTVGDAFGAFSREYEKLISHLNAARVANQAFMSRHGKTLSHISGALETHLDAIGSHRNRAEVIASERLERTHQIRARVGKAIFALQIGDITRQRIEHVELALEMLQDRLGEAAGAEAVAAICHLQCSQLDQTIVNFEAEVNEFAENIDQLGNHAAAVLREGSSEAEALLCSGSTALSVLVSELRRICLLVDEFERSLLEREKIIDDVTCSVMELAGHLESVRTIERQIRMLSFNATIQCCRVEEEAQGRALRAVAQQLRELSSDTIAAASAMMRGLKRAETQTKRFSEQPTSVVSQQITSIKRGALDTVKMLEGITDRLRQGTEAVKTAGKQAERFFEGTARRVSGRQRTRNASRQACSRLGQLATSISREPNPRAVSLAIANQLRAQYTMEDERRIHDEFFGKRAELGDDDADVPTSESVEAMFL